MLRIKSRALCFMHELFDVFDRDGDGNRQMQIQQT